MLVRYDTNNSGGNWWLKDKDWKDLEEAGWTVEWRKLRFLGAMATSASKEFPSVEDAIEEWESVVGQDADSEGCSCCGNPHNFYGR